MKTRVLHNVERGTTYRIKELLGTGGSGEVWSCESNGPYWSPICVKVTDDQDSWHHEAYMAELVRHHPRVIKVHETFPIIQPRRILYVVVMELADRGTLAELVREHGPWTERRAVREIRGLLDVLDLLHSGGVLHRDLTPWNVFACGVRQSLKLADFGIATHAPPKGAWADAFNPSFVDGRFEKKRRRRWSVRDDLWQVGHLLGVLLTGKVEPLGPGAIRTLACSPTTKKAVATATGEPTYCYKSAKEMAADLRLGNPPVAASRPDIPEARPRTLAGCHIVFTGKMALARAEASSLAEAAGAHVEGRVSARTDFLVVGTSGRWIADGAGGRKLLAAIARRRGGRPIRLVREPWFRHLLEA